MIVRDKRDRKEKLLDGAATLTWDILGDANHILKNERCSASMQGKVLSNKMAERSLSEV